jgi:hypothetical protein
MAFMVSAWTKGRSEGLANRLARNAWRQTGMMITYVKRPVKRVEQKMEPFLLTLTLFFRIEKDEICVSFPGAVLMRTRLSGGWL